MYNIVLAFLLSVSSLQGIKSPANPSSTKGYEASECGCEVEYQQKSITPTIFNRWKLVGFVDQNSDSIHYSLCGHTITLDITTGKYKGIGSSAYLYGFDGDSGANRFWGSYRLLGDYIEFSDILSTRSKGTKCEMEFEKKYYAAFRAKKLKYKLINNLLDIEVGNGLKLRFVMME